MLMANGIFHEMLKFHFVIMLILNIVSANGETAERSSIGEGALVFCTVQ